MPRGVYDRSKIGTKAVNKPKGKVGRPKKVLTEVGETGGQAFPELLAQGAPNPGPKFSIDYMRQQSVAFYIMSLRDITPMVATIPGLKKTQDLIVNHIASEIADMCGQPTKKEIAEVVEELEKVEKVETKTNGKAILPSPVPFVAPVPVNPS